MDEVVDMFHVYFAKSEKNTKVYVGFTSRNPAERVSEHNQGSNAWSSKNGPFKLVYYESYVCEKDGRLREKFYKTGIGKKIKKIIVEGLDG